ncbi:hypothetical protein [Hydrogenophaga laconesensis]|uniref:Uncharacterized protein n=1 Tax=Hydrogenophaga laconesensis TaxID=1805971 RepID=A0ABU1V8H6_9BURK|nr:hypothetical protein [Hydrogenophaga laconesensis]MDR7093722.1 hypothetical protein [Hydrogenophaga laconesensis]
MLTAQPFAESLSTWLGDTTSDTREMEGWRPGAVSPFQWMTTASAFSDTGGLVNGDELAELIREHSLLNAQSLPAQPVSMVARWIVSRSVVVIDSPWGHVLPLFQFDLPRATVHPAMPMVLAELGGVLEGAELALWFVTPNEWLGGERPAIAMQNTLQAVRHAARADRYVALGG